MRLVTALFVTVFAALAAAPAALAAEVTAQDPSRWVRVRANDGEANRVTVSLEDGVVIVRDAAGGLDGDESCTDLDPTEVRCAIGENGPRVWVELGDGDDELTVVGALESKVDGGAGNDVVKGGDGPDKLRGDDHDDTLDGGAGTDDVDGGEGDDVLLARDALRETVACGGGVDGGAADLEDDVAADCETVEKPLPPPGLEQVQPPAPA
ncbi:MAG: hypothetical protein M3389_09705, partial [Actinomycetota bacterium]|nr:hypothetical protein [Actinomycetota bacterium]